MTVPLKADEGGVGEMGAEATEVEDPIVEECLQDALAPYLGLLSPEELLEHRRLLTVFITTHPAARPIYERLLEGRRQRPMTAASGAVAKDGVLFEGDAEVVGSGTGGARR